MKKLLLILVLLLVALGLWCDKFNNMRLGYYTPTTGKEGFMGGISLGNRIERTVDIYIPTVDFFWRNDTNLRTVIYPGSTTAVDKSADVTTYYVPVLFQANLNLLKQTHLVPYTGGGFGYGLLWEDVYVAADADHEKLRTTKFYGGFNWDAVAGLRYSTSRHTGIYIEGFYNYGKLYPDVKQTPDGLTWKMIDMSGMGARIGLEVPMY